MKAGRAAVTVCSTAFRTLGAGQARALGHPELPIVLIPHPFGGRTRDEVRRIAEQCADDIAKVLAGSEPS